MAGDLRNYNHRGLIPRAIHHLFNEIDMRVDRIYKVQVGAAVCPGRPCTTALACRWHSQHFLEEL